MEKNICINKYANYEYFILEKYEAGIVLEGSEVKSLRQNNVSFKESFCLLYNGELLVKNMHIAIYDKAGAFNTKNSRRDRKLLMHKAEIVKITSKVNQKGLTLVPLRLYLRVLWLKWN